MKWYHWILIGLASVFALVVLLCSGGKIKIPIDLLKENIQTKAEVQKLEAELGRDKASEAIKEKHKQLLEDLDEEERQEVERLTSDPPALSKALLKAGRRARRKRV